jgi:hypothetical protein
VIYVFDGYLITHHVEGVVFNLKFKDCCSEYCGGVGPKITVIWPTRADDVRPRNHEKPKKTTFHGKTIEQEPKDYFSVPSAKYGKNFDPGTKI